MIPDIGKIVSIHMVLVILLIVVSSFSFSQSRFNLNVSQSYSDDWQTGKMHSVEISSNGDFRFKCKIDTLDASLNIRYAVGAAYDKPSDSANAYSRPTDNDLFTELVVKYPLGWKMDPYISFSGQTQIMEAFKYSRGNVIKTANFRDPVTTIESLGFAFGHSKGKEFVSSRIGLSLKQTRADKYTQMSDDPTTPLIKEKFKSETGIQWRTETLLLLDSAASYMGIFDFFASFGMIEKYTVKFQNEFQFFIWRFFGILIKFDFVYDEKQKKGLQLKQSIRFGVGVVI
jgi:hypothetical protein